MLKKIEDFFLQVLHEKYSPSKLECQIYKVNREFYIRMENLVNKNSKGLEVLMDRKCVKKAERSEAWNDYFLGIKSLQATWESEPCKCRAFAALISCHNRT